jgi:hypothetical protein
MTDRQIELMLFGAACASAPYVWSLIKKWVHHWTEQPSGSTRYAIGYWLGKRWAARKKRGHELPPAG